MLHAHFSLRVSLDEIASVRHAVLGQQAEEDAPGQGDGERVVLFDKQERYADVPDGGGELVFRDHGVGTGSSRPENAAWDLSSNGREGPKSVLLREHDFKHPELMPAAGEAHGDTLPTTCFHEHHGPFGEMQVAPQSPEMVVEQLRRNTWKGEGHSSCVRLAAGHAVTIRGHEHPQLSGGFGISTVRHEGDTGAEDLLYTNAFELVPQSFLKRPKRPRQRVMQSLETATVVGPDNEEIFVDELGRIKVQFHWDLEGKRDEVSSCWIRVAQAWSGSSWGAQFIPRVGMEVLVAFLGGDPDRPMVVGCVPNATHMPAFPLPANKTRSGWRSRSTPDNVTAGHNELSFDDTAGAEKVNVVAHRDLDITVTREMRTSVSGTSITEVASDQSINVVGARHVRVGGPSSVSYGAGGHMEILGGLQERIGGDRIAKVGQNIEESVSGSCIRTVEGMQEQTVKGPWSNHAESNYTLVVGDHEQVGHSEVQVRGTSSHQTDAEALISAGERLTLACGPSRIELAPDGVRITAPKIEISAPEVSVVGDGPALRLKDNAELVAERINLRGKDSSLELDKDATIKGTKVYLNCGPPPPPAETDDGEALTKKLSVKLSDEYFEPYAAKHYELRAMDFKAEGLTGPDGGIAEDIPKSARVAHIDLWTGDFPTGPRRSYDVAVDLLPPLETPPGLRHRLANLGYFKGRTSGDELDPATIAALREFQSDHELDVTGQPDAATLALIKKRSE